MAFMSLWIGLIPGAGVDRELIPVSIARPVPSILVLASILADAGRPTSTGNIAITFRLDLFFAELPTGYEIVQ